MNKQSIFAMVVLCCATLFARAADLSAMRREYIEGATVELQKLFNTTHEEDWQANRDKIECLVAGGADPNTMREGDDVPLLAAAAAYDDRDLVNCCIKHGAAVNNDSDSADCKPLFCAQSLSVAQLLIDSRANILDRDHYHSTVLHHAVTTRKDIEVLRFFLQQNLTKMKDKDGNTALHLHCLMHEVHGQKERQNRAFALIDGGADLQETNKQGKTPLKLLPNPPSFIARLLLSCASRQDPYQKSMIDRAAARDKKKNDEVKE